MSAIPQATNTAGPSVSLRLGRSRNLHSASCASQKQAQSSQNQRATDYFGVENAGTKNVVVLGGSYGGECCDALPCTLKQFRPNFRSTGMHAATVLAQKLPPSHRVILVERNSHFNRKSGGVALPSAPSLTPVVDLLCHRPLRFPALLRPAGSRTQGLYPIHIHLRQRSKEEIACSLETPTGGLANHEEHSLDANTQRTRHSRNGRR